MVRVLVATIVFICLGFIPVACSNSNENDDVTVPMDATELSETNNADTEEAVDASQAADAGEPEAADIITNKE